MSRFSKKTILVLVALLLCAVILDGMGMSALAAPDINRDKTGTLTIKPTYQEVVRSGGVFTIYYVASLDDSDDLSFTIEDAFAGAADEGLDINAIKTATDIERAVTILRGYISNVPADEIITLNRATDGDTVYGLELGVYMVIQTSAPSPYTAASAFLVFIPMTDSEDTVLHYDITAYPKLGYSSGGGGGGGGGNGGGGDVVITEIPSESPTDEPVDITEPEIPYGPAPDEPVDIPEPEIPLGSATEDPGEEIPDEPVPGSDAPGTGDETNIVLWIALLATGLIALLCVIFLNGKKKKGG